MRGGEDRKGDGGEAWNRANDRKAVFPNMDARSIYAV